MKLFTSLAMMMALTISQVSAYDDRSGLCVDDPTAMAGGMGGSNNLQLGWTLKPDTNSYTPGKQIKVTVDPKNAGDIFEGLLLFARATNNAHLGTWEVVDGFQTLDNQCKDWGLAKSTLSHAAEKHHKGPMTFTWTAPAIGLGPVEFRGLLVADGKTNWMQFPPVFVGGPGKVDDAKNTTIKPPAQGNSAASNTFAVSGISAMLVAGVMAFLA